MKIIDLLNKIANGEEVPKKIKYDNKTYFYDREAQDYSDFDKNYGLFSDFLNNKYGLNNCLNDEVEILEEVIKLQEKEIERLNNIIDELEKWLEQEYAIVKANSIEEPNNPEWYIKWNERKHTLDKLKELK